MDSHTYLTNGKSLARANSNRLGDVLRFPRIAAFAACWAAISCGGGTNPGGTATGGKTGGGTSSGGQTSGSGGSTRTGGGGQGSGGVSNSGGSTPLSTGGKITVASGGAQNQSGGQAGASDAANGGVPASGGRAGGTPGGGGASGGVISGSGGLPGTGGQRGTGGTIVVGDIWNLPKFPMAQGPFTADWKALGLAYSTPQWWRDAKFGAWAHWDPQSMPEKGDWYALRMYQQGSAQYNYHVATFGDPSEYGYKDICKNWVIDKWDPNALMDLYVQMGAKFFMSMGSHHDNFDNFDSAYQPWNSVKV